MKNLSPFRQEMQLSGGKDVKLFGGGDGAPCETGNAASSNSANTLSRCKRRKPRPYRSRSEPRQEVRAGLVNRRAHLISSRSDRGPHGEWPPTIAIWNRRWSRCAQCRRDESGVLTLGNVGVPWRLRTAHANQMLLHRSSMEEKKQRIDAARRITRSLGHRGETLEPNVIWR